jgi:hypothetical protein
MKKREREEEGREEVSERGAGLTHFPTLKVSRHCPITFLVNVCLREGKVS